MKPDEAIENLKGCVVSYEVDEHGNPNGNVTADLTMEIINMAISALEKQEEDRWIPVTEALPEKDGEYLVTYESGYAEDYGFDPIGIAPFEVDCEGFGIWQERFHPVSLGSLGSEWVNIPVTAWRPLPEPYTGGRIMKCEDRPNAEWDCVDGHWFIYGCMGECEEDPAVRAGAGRAGRTSAEHPDNR